MKIVFASIQSQLRGAERILHKLHLKIITVDSRQRKSIKIRSVESLRRVHKVAEPQATAPPPPLGVASVTCIPPGKKLFRRKYSFFMLILYAFYSSVFLHWCIHKEETDFLKMHTKCSHSLYTCYLHKFEAVEPKTFLYTEQHSLLSC